MFKIGDIVMTVNGAGVIVEPRPASYLISIGEGSYDMYGESEIEEFHVPQKEKQ